jgi:hypothetical protein
MPAISGPDLGRETGINLNACRQDGSSRFEAGAS